VQDVSHSAQNVQMSRFYAECAKRQAGQRQRIHATPIPLTTLKQDSDSLATSYAAAKEGGPKEIAQREKDHLTLEHDLDLLGSYALTENLGGFCCGKATEKTKSDDLGFSLVEFSQRVKGAVDGRPGRFAVSS
jgi:hypothetical protein